jgi:hypothetical protein
MDLDEATLARVDVGNHVLLLLDGRSDGVRVFYGVPHGAWMVLKGIDSLAALRRVTHSNGLTLAAFCEADPNTYLRVVRDLPPFFAHG